MAYDNFYSDLEKEKARKIELEKNSKKKKLFEFFIGGELGETTFQFDTPAAHSILTWENMQSKSLVSEIKMNITNKFNIFYEYENSKYSRGTGSDDDIQNNYGVYSIGKRNAFGSGSSNKIGIGYEFLNFGKWHIESQIGYIRKKFNLKMGDQYSDYNIGYFEGVGQITDSAFSGTFLGLKFINRPDLDNQFALTLEYYQPKYKGTQYWPHRNLSWGLSGNPEDGNGYGVKIENEFRIHKSIWLRFYGKFQYMRVSRLIEEGYNDQLYISPSPSVPAVTGGHAKFSQYSLGLGILFK